MFYVRSCSVYDFSANKKTIHVGSKKNIFNNYSKSKLIAEGIEGLDTGLFICVEREAK